MELSTLNGQLKITNGSNEEFYKFETMKSISPAVDAKGNWYVAINFIANDKNNSLRLYTETISNIVIPNTQDGATILARIISQWANPFGYAIGTRSPFVLSSTGAGTIAAECSSFSIYNSGAAAGTVTLSGGTPVSIAAGVTLNFDAGGLGYIFLAGSVVWNATGTTFIVTYSV